VKAKGLAVISGAVLTVSVVGYCVGWQTGIGRLLRGVSGVSIKNDSATPLRNVDIRLGFGDFGSRTSRFDSIRPHQRVQVATDKGDVYVWKVSFEHGTNTIIDEIPARGKIGTALELVVDSSGKISYAR
jgi:hypothetical protein